MRGEEGQERRGERPGDQQSENSVVGGRRRLAAAEAEATRKCRSRIPISQDPTAAIRVRPPAILRLSLHCGNHNYTCGCLLIARSPALSLTEPSLGEAPPSRRAPPADCVCMCVRRTPNFRPRQRNQRPPTVRSGEEQNEKNLRILIRESDGSGRMSVESPSIGCPSNFRPRSLR